MTTKGATGTADTSGAAPTLGAAAAGAASDADDEPITIAEAARRCGVHPNTVRRLVHRGTLPALMVRSRYGNTWLVSAAELRQILSQPRPRFFEPISFPHGATQNGSAAGTPESGAPDDVAAVEAREPAMAAAADAANGPPDSTEDAGDAVAATAVPAAPSEPPPDASPSPASAAAAGDTPSAGKSMLEADGADTDRAEAGPHPSESPAIGAEVDRMVASAVDLSLDRAQALERYTRSLLMPLVDLLRDREAALERREGIVRHQAERIGRLEREVEMLRSQLGRAVRAVREGATRDVAGTVGVATGLAAGNGEGALIADPAAPRDAGGRQIGDEVVALSSQVERLRGDLRLLAERLSQRSIVPDPPPTFAPATLSEMLASMVPPAAPVPSAAEPATATLSPPPAAPAQTPDGPDVRQPAPDEAPRRVQSVVPDAAPAHRRPQAGNPALPEEEGTGPRPAGNTGHTPLEPAGAAPPGRVYASDAERFWANAVARAAAAPAAPAAQPSASEQPDPFAGAEAAIRELQQALSQHQPGHSGSTGAAQRPPEREPQPPPRRPWWRFW